MTEQFNEIDDDLGLIQSQENSIDSPGAYLSARRQALGWSIEQVADQIKLAPRQVLAIECDDYLALPPMVVTRGFIRAYAKCLKVDVAPLMAMVRLEVVPKIDAVPLRRAIPMNFSESRFPLMGNRNSVLSKWNMGVIFLILLLLSFLLAQRMGWLPDLSKVTVVASIIRDDSIPEKISSHVESNATVFGPEVAKVNTVIAPVLTQTSISGLKDALHVPVVASPASPNDAAGKNQLMLQAHDDSWIEIKRANNSIVFSRILKAGEIEKFEINEPVLLTIGNVAGMGVTFRGESLNARAGGNGNVARINLK